MKQKYIDLKNTPLNECSRPIKEVSRGHLANEYGDKIEDYSQIKSPLTNRLISPYVTSETHGLNVFDWLVDYLEFKLASKSKVLDLGCGAGELMYLLSDEFKVFGTTIHIGEVKYGRETYGLADICPIDMREIEDYFSPEYFDCIIAHCSLHFITQDERQDLVNNTVYNLLKPDGIFILVDYKGDLSSGVNNISTLYKNITPKEYTTMGTLSVLEK
jgi:SAM-dependent methyltransferase